MIPFFQGGEEEASKYSHRSHKKIYPVCPFCHTISKKLIRIDDIWKCRGFSCACKDHISFPNKVIYSVMEQLYEMGYVQYFEREYSFNGERSKYDMYFEMEGKKYIVEMDGGIGHGHEPNINNMSAEESLNVDRLKDEVAIQNNCTMIRIDSTISDIDKIKNKLLQSDLSLIFDLTKINWNRVLEYTCTNLIKEISDFKTKYPLAFTSDIMAKFHISRSSTINYLKKGARLGWCNYNGKEEMIRNNRLKGNKKGQCISVLKIDSNEEYCFPSVLSIEEKSLDKYGIKMTNYCIKKHVIDNPYYYSGYYIKLISKEYYIDWAKKHNIIE